MRNLLKSRRTRNTVRVEPDRVWLHDEARLAGLWREMESRLVEGSVVLVAHLEETRARIDSFVDGLSAHRPVRDAHHARRMLAELATVSDAAVFALDGAQLEDHETKSSHVSSGGTVSVIAAERYPLRHRDDRIVNFAASLPMRVVVTYHVSMDDPLMGAFVGEQTRAVLARLGMTESECLASGMLSRTIERAQRKLARSMASDPEYTTAAAWREAIASVQTR